jgi:transglutaminase-like putative cysteine protease
MTTHEGLTIEAFVALLALMISLKLLESSVTRDRMLTVILCYFLIVGGLFFDDSILATFYMLFAVLSTTAVMIYINQPTRGLLVPVKLSATLMIQATPLMLIMFLLFPRIQGGLWGRNTINSAQTGFSDELRFGSIAQLAQNTAVAFRVEFNGEMPARNQLYWRGIVLGEFDGITWRRKKTGRGIPSRVQETTRPVSYTLTLEPHNEHWLITLDLPTKVSLKRAWLFSDHTSFSWRRISQRVAYVGESYLNAKTFGQSGDQKTALRLPKEMNPQTRELAASWAKQTQEPGEIVQLALNYFQEQPFSYSLSPGVLTDNTDTKAGKKDLVDRFLFDSRKGFCEHYASSFAYLMRAAGVPARIVAGYLGGDVNPYGGYLVVRQSDAHAWCEVWLPARGWVRIDPTAAVAPERLRRDVSGALSPGETTRTSSFLLTGPLGKWLKSIQSAWDLANSRWNQWVMGYSASEQIGLFSRLGVYLDEKKDLAKRMSFFLLIVLPLLFLAAFLISRPKKKTEDKVAAYWKQYCEKLTNIGVVKPPGQGPMDYMHAVLEQRPDLDMSIGEITTLYIALRYKKKIKQGDVRRLGTLVKDFVPQKQPLP